MSHSHQSKTKTQALKHSSTQVLNTVTTLAAQATTLAAEYRAIASRRIPVCNDGKVGFAKSPKRGIKQPRPVPQMPPAHASQARNPQTCLFPGHRHRHGHGHGEDTKE